MNRIDPAEPRCPTCRSELHARRKKDVVAAYLCQRCNTAWVMEALSDVGLKLNVLAIQGAWDRTRTYKPGERVNANGIEWLAIRASPFHEGGIQDLSPLLDSHYWGSFHWIVLPRGWDGLPERPEIGDIGPRSRPSGLADARTVTSSPTSSGSASAVTRRRRAALLTYERTIFARCS